MTGGEFEAAVEEKASNSMNFSLPTHGSAGNGVIKWGARINLSKKTDKQSKRPDSPDVANIVLFDTVPPTLPPFTESFLKQLQVFEAMQRTSTVVCPIHLTR